jgi:hypothetical protein
VYYAFFGVKLVDVNKPWAPQKVCYVCVEGLRRWFKGEKKSLRFGIPMIWREQKNHRDDCYFCSCDVKGHNSENKKVILHPNLPSALLPFPRGPDVPIPQPPVTLQDDSTTEEDADKGDQDFPFDSECEGPQLFTQPELNDLVRDLGLSKEKALLLGSRLKENNLLASGTIITSYRSRDREFTPCFSQEGELVYCSDIQGLMKRFGIHYKVEKWRLFIDSSKRSLKAVPLNNGNNIDSLPVGLSVHLKETCENFQLLLTKLKYRDHEWMICGDLKVLCVLPGQQAGYTKCPCFLYEWDSRARSKLWEQKQWQSWNTMQLGNKNILRQSLVDRRKILLPHLHIKLGIMKEYVKALPKTGSSFTYLGKKFPLLSKPS